MGGSWQGLIPARQTGKHTGKHTGRHTCWHTGKHTCRHTAKHNVYIGKQASTLASTLFLLVSRQAHWIQWQAH